MLHFECWTLKTKFFLKQQRQKNLLESFTQLSLFLVSVKQVVRFSCPFTKPLCWHASSFCLLKMHWKLKENKLPLVAEVLTFLYFEIYFLLLFTDLFLDCHSRSSASISLNILEEVGITGWFAHVTDFSLLMGASNHYKTI